MIETFIAKFGLYIGAAAAILIGIFTWDSSRVHQGEANRQHKVDAQNGQLHKTGSSAAIKSSSAQLGDAGVLVDPSYRD